MNRCVIFTILLAYIAQSSCFYADGPATPKVYISPEKYRLPRTIFPELYTLNVFTHINDDQGFKFYGDVRIKVIFRLFTFNSILTRYRVLVRFFREEEEKQNTFYQINFAKLF